MFILEIRVRQSIAPVAIPATIALGQVADVINKNGIRLGTDGLAVIGTHRRLDQKDSNSQRAAAIQQSFQAPGGHASNLEVLHVPGDLLTACLYLDKDGRGKRGRRFQVGLDRGLNWKVGQGSGLLWVEKRIQLGNGTLAKLVPMQIERQ